MFKVVWDTRQCPITFDFAFFLAAMDCYRQLSCPDKDVQLMVQTKGFRSASARDTIMEEDEKAWRLKSVIRDTCDLLPSIKTLVLTQDEFPADETYNYPNYQKGRVPYEAKDVAELFQMGAKPHVLTAPPFAKKVTKFRKPFVTLTLRTSRFYQSRNADLGDWFKFYQYLRADGLTVMVVPDHEDVLVSQQYLQYDWFCYTPASLDIRLRFALYERAVMNFGSSNGPIGAAFLSNAPMLQFDQLRGGVVTKEFWANTNGFEVGGQFPWSKPTQRMTWTDSTFENLVSEWKSMNLQ